MICVNMGIYDTPLIPSRMFRYILRGEGKAARLLARDIYQTYFGNDPYDKEVWAKYRREILEYGGSHANELGMLTDFFGTESGYECSCGRVETGLGYVPPVWVGLF